MMTITTSSIPATAAIALMSSIGRSCLWLVKKYAAAPLTSTAVIALTLGLAMAANNALYAQIDHHPAPLFFGSPDRAVQSAQVGEILSPLEIAPPPVRSAPVASFAPALVADAAPNTQIEIAPAVADSEVSNTELADAQRKLQSMGLFVGDVDGFYGPKTAEAIRAFEMRNGMVPKGDMSRTVIDAILRADASDNASINAARSTARGAETQATAIVEAMASPQQSSDLVAGQRALQALLSPQLEALAPIAQPAESLVASVAAAPPPTQSAPMTALPDASPNPQADTNLIEKIQIGLASLGFLHSRIDGVAGEETARAIRNFEVFNNYEVSGSVTPELIDLLIAAGAEL